MMLRCAPRSKASALVNNATQTSYALRWQLQVLEAER